MHIIRQIRTRVPSIAFPVTVAIMGFFVCSKTKNMQSVVATCGILLLWICIMLLMNRTVGPWWFQRRNLQKIGAGIGGFMSGMGK